MNHPAAPSISEFPLWVPLLLQEQSRLTILTPPRQCHTVACPHTPTCACCRGTMILSTHISRSRM